MTVLEGSGRMRWNSGWPEWSVLVTECLLEAELDLGLGGCQGRKCKAGKPEM